MAALYLTPAERYTAALGGFYYGDLPEPGTVYTQLIKDILDGSTPDKEPKNILARFIYSLYISDLGDPYPRYELAKLLYWKLHNITPTKSGSILTVTIDGKEDYMTINTDLSRLWYKVLFGSKTDVITEFPYIFNTMQNKLSDWELFGNTETSGVPIPDSPIMPQGTGERTGQIIEYPYSNESGTINGVQWTISENGHIKGVGTTSSGTNFYLNRNCFLKAGTYTLKIYGKHEGMVLRLYDGVNATIIATILQSNTDSFTTFTLDSDTSNECRIYFNVGSAGANIDIDCDVMFNSGTTALPYEPWGIKIPISSANTTTPVYLGEVQTERKVKKWVLTGDENWNVGSANYYTHLPSNGRPYSTALCTHAKNASTIDNNGAYLYLQKSTFVFETLTDLKTYLQQQYANGTPVTVWYVLAEPETGIVNEPLMKIGDYADSMSRAQTGIDIPTVIGQNTLDVLTTVKPSSMSIEYTSADENRSRSKRISLLKSPLKKGLIK